MASTFDSVWVPTLEGNFLTEYEGVLEQTWSYPLCKKIDAQDEFIKAVDVDSVGAVKLFANNRRQAQKPNVYTLIQQNLPYELTMDIDVEDVRRDKLGIFESRAQEMGGKFADHINKLVISQIQANPKCFDGVNFFASTHPVNGTTQSNVFTSANMGVLASSNYTGSTAANPTPVQMAAVILYAQASFYGLIDNAGDPINGGAKEFTFVTSNPGVYAGMVTAINSLQLSQGQTNILISMQDGNRKDSVNPKSITYRAMFDPRLGSLTSTTFYGFRTDSPVKPFIWGEESGLEIQHLGDGSDHAVKENKYLWGAKTVRSVGVGRYQHAASYTLS